MAAIRKTLLLAWSVLLFCYICAINGNSELKIDSNGKRYYFIRRMANWFQANHACSSLGMSLASIESEEEYNNLRKYWADKNLFGNTFWLSGTNLDGVLATEYTWLSSGNGLYYANWAAGQPSGSSDTSIYTDEAFKLATVASTERKYYICSRPLVPRCGITGRCKRNANFFY